METLLQDIRFGVRMLGKHGAFTFVALLTLALGIGANTAIFSVANAIVFRPLPYSAPQQLVGVWTKDLKRPGSQYPASLPTFRDWQQQSHLFSGFAAYAFNRFHVSGNEGPDETRGTFTSANFFEVMGVKPVLGRVLQPADERERVVVIGDELWRRRFNADKNVVGKTINLNSESFTVIGVNCARALAYANDRQLPEGIGSVACSRGVHSPDCVCERGEFDDGAHGA